MPAKKTAAAKAEPELLVVGVCGTSEISKKAITAHMKEFLANNENTSFVFPLVKELWTPSMQTVLDIVTAAEIPYTVLCDETAMKSRNFSPARKNATEVIEIKQAPSVRLGNIVGKAQGTILVFWDGSDDADAEQTEGEKAAIKVLQLGGTAHDFIDSFSTFGLSDIFEDGEAPEPTDPEDGEEVDDDDVEPDDDDAPEAEEEEVPAPKAPRAKYKAIAAEPEPEPEPEPEDDDDDDDEIINVAINAVLEGVADALELAAASLRKLAAE